MRAALPFLALLLIPGSPGGRAALAVPAGAVPAEPVGSIERIGRGPSFAPGNTVIGTSSSLARPVFDPSAGASGSGGVQPARPGPVTLSGSYSAPPTVREASASVMVADAFAAADGRSGAIPHGAAGQSSANASNAALTSVAEAAALSRLSGSLIRSSVFVNGNSATAAPRTVQSASSLTIYQALQSPATENLTIDAYPLTIPAAAASRGSQPATLSVPMKVTSSSYGFLNSSLTVFSDEFGSFAGIGQTFNGLTSLNIDEPAAIAIVAEGIAALAAIRRRRKSR